MKYTKLTPQQRAHTIVSRWLRATEDDVSQLETSITKAIELAVLTEYGLTLERIQRVIDDVIELRMSESGVRKDVCKVLINTLKTLKSEIADSSGVGARIDKVLK